MLNPGRLKSSSETFTKRGAHGRIWRHGSPGNITFPTEGCCAESMSPRWCTCQVRRYYCERSKRPVSVIPQTADSLLCNLRTRLISSSLIPMQAFPPSIFWSGLGTRLNQYRWYNQLENKWPLCIYTFSIQILHVPVDQRTPAACY